MNAPRPERQFPSTRHEGRPASAADRILARARRLRPSPLAQYRLAVAARVLAASLGGYVLASVGTAAAALLLPRVSPLGRADAVLAATLSGFLLYAGCVLWVFSVRTAGRAWLGLCLAAGVLALAVVALRN